MASDPQCTALSADVKRPSAHRAHAISPSGLRYIYPFPYCRTQFDHTYAALYPSSTDAIERAFARLSSLTVKASRIGGADQGEGQVGTKLGTAECEKPRNTASCWCERGDSKPHGFTRQILSLKQGDDSKEDQQPTSAESSKTGKNPQPRRNRKRGKVIPFPKTGTE